MKKTKTTTIHLHTYDFWAKCACGYSMRIPSPHDDTDTTKMPRFCCGCGLRIIFTGQHPHLPHAFIPCGKATMNWGGLKIGDQLPGCALCGVNKEKHGRLVAARRNAMEKGRK